MFRSVNEEYMFLVWIWEDQYETMYDKYDSGKANLVQRAPIK